MKQSPSTKHKMSPEVAWLRSSSVDRQAIYIEH